MAKALFTLKLRAADAIPAKVKKRLRLQKGEFDESFGVIAIDPHNDLYAVMVEEEALARLEPDNERATGPFANPRIETFGPPS